MDKQSIKVTVIEDSRREDCEAGCGIDWSAPDSLTLASRQIEARFGSGIRLACLDIARAPAGKEAREWGERIEKQALMLPLLLVNGQLRISGPFDIRQMMDAIEVEMEMGV